MRHIEHAIEREVKLLGHFARVCRPKFDPVIRKLDSRPQASEDRATPLRLWVEVMTIILESHQRLAGQVDRRRRQPTRSAA